MTRQTTSCAPIDDQTVASDCCILCLIHIKLKLLQHAVACG